jgi:hypothetical protein
MSILKGQVNYLVRDGYGTLIIQNASVKLDKNGGFMIEFDIPDNAHLGNAQVEFTHEKGEVFTHHFQIQEVRASLHQKKRFVAYNDSLCLFYLFSSEGRSIRWRWIS